VYPEQLLGKISKKAFTTLGCQPDEFYEGMGYYFVEFTGKFGYFSSKRNYEPLLNPFTRVRRSFSFSCERKRLRLKPKTGAHGENVSEKRFARNRKKLLAKLGHPTLYKLALV
jgi:hypothetical protein